MDAAADARRRKRQEKILKSGADRLDKINATQPKLAPVAPVVAEIDSNSNLPNVDETRQQIFDDPPEQEIIEDIIPTYFNAQTSNNGLGLNMTGTQSQAMDALLSKLQNFGVGQQTPVPASHPFARIILVLFASIIAVVYSLVDLYKCYDPSHSGHFSWILSTNSEAFTACLDTLHKLLNQSFEENNGLELVMSNAVSVYTTFLVISLTIHLVQSSSSVKRYFSPLLICRYSL